MSKPINLRQFRKRKARAEKKKTAEANRLAHGQPKPVTALKRLEEERAGKALDAHKRERDAGPECEDGSKPDDETGGED